MQALGKMLQLKMGDDAAKTLYDLYDRHYDRVRRFVGMLVKEDFTADDLSQETFLRAQRSLASLRDPAKAGSWLIRIAHNLCRDHFRKGPQAGGSREEAESVSSGLPGTVHLLERRQMSSCIQQQLEKLPESQRIPLILYDMLGFAHKEIAEILGISIENVKVRLHRARKRFRGILRQNCRFERDDRDVFVCEPKRNIPL
jgi:RNA polymerase sigma-70 factor (ECF subfamily)